MISIGVVGSVVSISVDGGGAMAEAVGSHSRMAVGSHSRMAEAVNPGIHRNMVGHNSHRGNSDGDLLADLPRHLLLDGVADLPDHGVALLHSGHHRDLHRDGNALLD